MFNESIVTYRLVNHESSIIDQASINDHSPMNQLKIGLRLVTIVVFLLQVEMTSILMDYEPGTQPLIDKPIGVN